MWTSMWFTSILAILMADTRTGALQNKAGDPRRCFHCPNSNATCYQQKVSVLCPADKPHCGTVAVGPRYVSSLECLPSSDNRCSIDFNSLSVLELSCVCTVDDCNAPFLKKIQNQLQEFADTNLVRNDSDLTTAFLKYLNLEKATDVYKALTNETEEIEITTTLSYITLSTAIKSSDIPIIISNNTNRVDTPHAEPLKHEATVPPDDDEDESEGSGSYDDAKSPKNPASAPAAPSSYLPAEENKASSGFKASLAMLFLIMFSTI